jgi:hypothetical protein
LLQPASRQPWAKSGSNRHQHGRREIFLDRGVVFAETNLRRKRQLDGIAKANAAGVTRRFSARVADYPFD